MNHLLFLTFSIVLSLTSHDIFSQRIGEWTSYLPYQSGVRVTQSEHKIYYGTEWSILKIDKEDFSSERISKVNGLSDIGIQEIAYDLNQDQLIITYSNSNIDIVREGQIINLPNIKLNTDLTSNKSINDIFISEQMIYLSTGFGLVTILSDNLLFGSTTFTDIPVQDAVVYDNQVFIATNEGIYFAPTNGSQNLIDFSLWQLMDERFGLSPFYSSSGVAIYNDKLYIIADDVLYSWDGNQMEEQYTPPSSNISLGFLSSEGEKLMIGVLGSDGRGDVFFFDGANFSKSGNGCNDFVQDAIQDQYGRIWYADRFGGFRTAEGYTSECQRLSFDSPFSHEVSQIAINDDEVFIASGGIRDNYDYNFTRSGFYTLDEEGWTNINQDNSSFILENDLQNFLTIKTHPSRDEVFIGTYWGGLLRFNPISDEYILYNDTNSSLLGTTGDIQRERVTGLLFDNEENLWITSFGSPRPLAIFSQDEQWINFSLGANKNLIDVAQDEFGYLWIPAFGNNGGCYIYDPGSDLLSSSDDRIRFLSTSTSNLTSNTVNTVSVDLEGAVWLGTGEGPVVFDCGSDPFEFDNCSGDRIKVIQDSIVAFLLADQDILTIEIDGGNQKWFGTRNGLFVLSPDGEEEIYRFTEDNSPLFDNRIRDIAFDKESGEMYIGTDKGLQSFKTPSTEGKSFHQKSEVLVYPNPVTPNYDGPIAIKGLVRDALVKITDLNGNLVTEVRALGGQAIWDGNDSIGKKVKSGVYLIFSTDDNAFDSPDSFVTKIMVIR